MNEKCIIDPQRDCLGLEKARMLEKQMDEYRRQSREDHSEIFSRLGKLESAESARNEQYAHILEKLDGLGDKMDGIGKRVTDLEMKPGKQWDKITGSILAALVLAIVAYFVGKMGIPM